MYDEYVYLLDLCTFSYQLHAQTLVWPVDPYYEQWRESKVSVGGDQNARREAFMAELRKTLDHGKVIDWRGPGVCSGKPTNVLLDPIISDYRRINPWRASFTRPDMESDGWVVYNTPREITERIKNVNIVYDNPPQTDLALHQPLPGAPVQVPSDILYCFEGATGAVGMQGDPNPTKGDLEPAWSIMGFVLARTITDVDIKRTTANPAQPVEVGYDIYIAFRGSRSGLLRLMQAKSSKAGNPDWVTDLELLKHIDDPDINPHGRCARGFRTSLKHTLPNIMDCLKRIHTRKNHPPRSIYVTGHSLGGALASAFTSAVLLGTKYGPNGLGQAMPDEIRIWPWRATQVVTFGAPGGGDAAFQETFDKVINSSRVWVHGDVITLQALGSPVGEGYHLKPGIGHDVMPKAAHDPCFIRRFLIRDRRSRGFDLSNTPANTGNEEPLEPWRVFNSCRAALAHIRSCHQQLHPAFTFADVLPNFDDECERYFRAVHDALWALKDPHFQQKMQILGNLRAHFKAPDPAHPYTAASRILDVRAVWRSVEDADIVPDWTGSTKAGAESRFARFVGLMLFISALKRDSALLQSIATMGGPEARAFNELLDSNF
jgi:hypothetical protein